MLIVQVNGLHTPPLQTSLTRAPDVIRLAVHTTNRGVRGIADDSKFRRQHNFVTLPLDGAPDQFFICVGPVYIGGIKKIQAEFGRAVNRGNRFVVVASAVKLRHAHAAKAEGRYFETATSKFTKLHDDSFQK